MIESSTREKQAPTQEDNNPNLISATTVQYSSTVVIQYSSTVVIQYSTVIFIYDFSNDWITL